MSLVFRFDLEFGIFTARDQTLFAGKQAFNLVELRLKGKASCSM
jgi:hypothetical protein